MVAVTLIGALSGAALGLYFRATILIPASWVALIASFAAVMPAPVSTGEKVLWSIACVSALQVGYIIVSALDGVLAHRRALERAIRTAEGSSAQVTQAQAEASGLQLGSRRQGRIETRASSATSSAWRSV